MWGDRPKRNGHGRGDTVVRPGLSDRPGSVVRFHPIAPVCPIARYDRYIAHGNRFNDR